jgi:hypothetical protein
MYSLRRVIYPAGKQPQCGVANNELADSTLAPLAQQIPPRRAPGGIGSVQDLHGIQRLSVNVQVHAYGEVRDYRQN